MNQSSLLQPKRQLRMPAVSCCCSIKSAVIQSVKSIFQNSKAQKVKKSIQQNLRCERFSLKRNQKVQIKLARRESPFVDFSSIKVRSKVRMNFQARVLSLSRFEVCATSEKSAELICRVIQWRKSHYSMIRIQEQISPPRQIYSIQ